MIRAQVEKIWDLDERIESGDSGLNDLIELLLELEAAKSEYSDDEYHLTRGVIASPFETIL